MQLGTILSRASCISIFLIIGLIFYVGLPSQLRDAVLSYSDEGLAAPESAINKEYITQQQLVRLDTEGDDVLANETSERLLKIARSVATDRAQPRIKMFQVPKPVEGSTTEDRKRSRYVT